MPAIERIVFVRHGQTDFNALGRFQGSSDIPLNEVGRAQARAAGQVLAGRLGGGAQVRVVSSPLARAHETAQIVADVMGVAGAVPLGGVEEAAGVLAGGGEAVVGGGVVPCDEGDVPWPVVAVDPRLTERSYGHFEGLTRAEIRRDYPEAFQRWVDTGECPEIGMESSGDVGRRVRRAVLDRARQAGGGASPGGDTVAGGLAEAGARTLLVVSHGAAIARGILALIGLDPLVFTGLRGLDNCHWSELVGAREPGTWRLASHNIGADPTCA